MVTTDAPAAAPTAPYRRRRPRPTTVAAVAVLVVAVVAGALTSRHGHAGPSAAVVGPDRIPDAAVEREVSAILAEPRYAAALRASATTAIVAPVVPGFVASANGDPDDLRIVAGGPAGTRPITTADLRAQVLTRLLYLSALRQQLRAHHTAPDSLELAYGAEQARADAGLDQAGRPIYDDLPSWYRHELATRAADVEALVRALAGANAVSAADVAAAYQRQAPVQFTTVCLRSLLVAPGGATQAGAGLASDPAQGRDDGCAPMSGWANDVAAAVERVPIGGTATVSRLGRAAVLAVTGRSTEPLSAVAGVVRAQLLARFADLVGQTVEAQLALDKVTVAARYGTYQSFASDHEVLPADALAPAAPPAAVPGGSPAPTVPPAHGQLDPFD